MAIGEALAHGVPVLTTTGAPWPMLATRGCGWRVAPTADGITEGLRQATSFDPSALTAMGESGREFVRKEFCLAEYCQAIHRIPTKRCSRARSCCVIGVAILSSHERGVNNDAASAAFFKYGRDGIGGRCERSFRRIGTVARCCRRSVSPIAAPNMGLVNVKDPRFGAAR